MVGLLYLVAMGSLLPQVLALIGERGMFPVAERLDAHRRDFPSVRRFVDLPTVFWLSTHPAWLRAVPLLGAACGALAFYGGDLGWWALLVGWICFLSLDVVGLIFPWDSLLLEVGFLVLFVPHPEALPGVVASQMPEPTVIFMFQWLVIRLMWGFAKVKFIGTEKGDELYLKGFFTWMPVPNPVGWYAQHAPNWFLVGSLYFMFFAEVVAPGLALFAGPLRLVGAVSLIALMVGIQLTGNWGYFNLGYAALCLCLFDVNASIVDAFAQPSSLWATPQAALINATMIALFVPSLVYFLLNTWFNRVWVHWPLDDLLYERPWARAVVAFFRTLSPFRILNGYGVFPPNSAPPIRLIPVFEGSDDGDQWRAYRYKFIPTDEESPPPVVAPHHPRLDHAVHYAGLGMTDQSLMSSLIGDGNPHNSYTRYSWLERTLQRLLTGDAQTLALFGHNPFPDAPPRYGRVSMYALRTTSLTDKRATSKWWHSRRVGTLVNATGRDPRVLSDWLPTPELFHPDWVGWKKRAPALKAVREAAAQGAPFEQAALAGSDLSTEHMAAFWREFVPFVQAQRGQWTGIEQRVEALRERFDLATRERFERILERLCWVLREPLEPHMYGGIEPKLELRSNFRFHLLLHEIVLDGREALEATLAQPSRAVERLSRVDDASALYALALLRYETIEFHIRVFRWADLGVKARQKQFPGIIEFFDFLTAHEPREEDWRPVSHKDDAGEWTVTGFEPLGGGAL